MGRSDNVTFKNDKNGFRKILLIEAALTLVMLYACFDTLRSGWSSHGLYALICLVAMCYITGRSAKRYMELRREERKAEKK